MSRTSENRLRSPGRRRAALGLLAVLGSTVLIAGCGQKGPLFLPEEGDPEGEKKKEKVTTGPGARALA